MPVPFLDLAAQYRTIAHELDETVLRVARSGGYIMGADLDAFEADFATYVGVNHAVGVSSGLDALRLALLAADVGPGDEVIIPSTTFIATALAVSSVGAEPVLVDPDEDTANLTAEGVRRAITDRTACVIPVHLYGLPTPMAKLQELAEEHELCIIEDAAQSHGATIDGKRTGSLSRMGCFSFYPGKNLGAMGDGGAVVTDDPDLADRLRQLGNYGQERKYVHIIQGYNHRLDALQAAVLRVKLGHLDRWNESRRLHAKRYDEGLKDLPVTCPAAPSGASQIYHLYVIRTDRRDALQEFLDRKGVSTLIHYPVPIHLQPAYRTLEKGEGAFPIAERRASQILSLPMYAELTSEQIDEVINGVREFFSTAS